MSTHAHHGPKQTLTCVTLAVALTALSAPGAAAAATPLSQTSASLAATTATCKLGGSAFVPPMPAAPLSTITTRPISKASAILGGQGSALDAIRSQQTSLTKVGPLLMATATGPMIRLEPSAAGLPLPLTPCAGVAAIETMATPLAALRPVSPAPIALFQTSPIHITAAPAGLAPIRLPRNEAVPGLRPSRGFLDSRRIPIQRTSFDHDWARVKAEKPRLNRGLRQILRSSGTDRQAQLETVNRWVNRNITFADDRDLFQQADFWAGANATLRLRKGDCEDFALLKMHLLAAAGIPREDMIVTIARDLVRRADHAVLIVKIGDGHVMLDNATDTILDASAANDYRPVLSFGASQKWLHGY